MLASIATTFTSPPGCPVEKRDKKNFTRAYYSDMTPIGFTHPFIVNCFYSLVSMGLKFWVVIGLGGEILTEFGSGLPPVLPSTCSYAASLV